MRAYGTRKGNESYISYGKQDKVDVHLPHNSESSVAIGQEAAACLPQLFLRGRAIEHLDWVWVSIRQLVPSKAVPGLQQHHPEGVKWLENGADKIQGPSACGQGPHSPETLMVTLTRYRESSHFLRQGLCSPG